MTNLVLTLNLAVAGPDPLSYEDRAELRKALSIWIETNPRLRVIGVEVDGWQERERQAGTKIVNH
jgi:hypothetical protein